MLHNQLESTKNAMNSTIFKKEGFKNENIAKSLSPLVFDMKYEV